MTNNNVPKLRFPEFSDGWEVKKLGDIILKLSSGVSVNSIDEPIKETGEYGILKTSCISSGKFYPTQNKKIVPNEVSKAKLNPLADTILISRMNTPQLVGESGYIDNDYPNLFIPDRLWMTEIGIQNNAKFLSILLSSSNMMEKISNIASGTSGSMKNISKPNFLDIECTFPTLPEQQKIASFLSTVDEKLQALKKKKSLLEIYKKGVMQKLFSQQIRFKDDEENDFEDWEVNKLGDVTRKVDKKNKEKEILPVYSISNKNGFVHQSEQFDGVDSVERGYDTSLYKIIEPQTFAYNPARINVGSIGYSGILEKVLVSSLYVTFKTASTVSDLFFSYFLQTKHFNKSVIRNSEGGVRDYLFYENFSQIRIDLPSFPEQTKIANFLTAIDEKINKVDVQIKQTELWKKGLLQQMFV